MREPIFMTERQLRFAFNIDKNDFFAELLLSLSDEFCDNMLLEFGVHRRPLMVGNIPRFLKPLFVYEGPKRSVEGVWKKVKPKTWTLQGAVFSLLRAQQTRDQAFQYLANNHPLCVASYIVEAQEKGADKEALAFLLRMLREGAFEDLDWPSYGYDV